jgi:hypothetical protein
MKIEFPSSYPTSCLLGYVDLTDCIQEDSYKEQVTKYTKVWHVKTIFIISFLMENQIHRTFLLLKIRLNYLLRYQ